MAIEPEERAKALAAKVGHDERLGEVIGKLRVAKGLRQSDVACLSERQVRSIEKWEGATHEALSQLARAHHMGLEYLEAVAGMIGGLKSAAR